MHLKHIKITSIWVRGYEQMELLESMLSSSLILRLKYGGFMIYVHMFIGTSGQHMEK